MKDDNIIKMEQGKALSVSQIRATGACEHSATRLQFVALPIDERMASADAHE
jgi:hypothetical protein